MIIGLTGTFAAGKDAAAEYLKQKGFFYTSLSDLVREECTRQNRPIDRDTCRILANEMRGKSGPNYFAKLALEKIKESGAKNALVVSIRNIGEVAELKQNPDFKLVAVDAPIELRYQRAIARKSEKDLISFETFKAQEEEEMTSQKANEMQIGTILKIADYTIVNDGTLKELYKKIDNLFK
jgi:dephospho-CoA kinase